MIKPRVCLLHYGALNNCTYGHCLHEQGLCMVFNCLLLCMCTLKWHTKSGDKFVVISLPSSRFQGSNADLQVCAFATPQPSKQPGLFPFHS